MQKVIHEICRYLERHAAEPLTLAGIAKKAGYSSAHLQRTFTRMVGISPKAYQNAFRRKQFKENLKEGASVSGAIYSAGYGSVSRVYENAGRKLGMTPRQYREGGKNLQIHYAICPTRLGKIVIAATAKGICMLQFIERNPAAQVAAEFPQAIIVKMPRKSRPLLRQWMHALNIYLTGQSRLQDLPLDIRGTAFQLQVWRYLQKIPSGETRSYAQVASGVGRPAAVRAAASACANNRVALLIPCHRVIRGDGQLAGYRWGLVRKRALLDLEKSCAEA